MSDFAPDVKESFGKTVVILFARGKAITKYGSAP